MTAYFKTFANDTDGAVTVDWVVLTAATVALAILVFGAISLGVQGRVGDVTTQMARTE